MGITIVFGSTYECLYTTDSQGLVFPTNNKFGTFQEPISCVLTPMSLDFVVFSPEVDRR